MVPNDTLGVHGIFFLILRVRGAIKGKELLP
jgi:hypothetical protein